MDVKAKLGVVIAGVTLAAVIAAGVWIGVGVAAGAQAAQARTVAQHEKVIYAGQVHTRVLAQSADIKAANDAQVAKALAVKLAAERAATEKAAAIHAAAVKAAQAAAQSAAQQTVQQATQTVTRQAVTAPDPSPASGKLPAGARVPNIPGTTSPDTTQCASRRASTVNGVPLCD